MVEFIRFEGVTLQEHRVGEGKNDVQWITYDYDHLLSIETLCPVCEVLWQVGARDPDCLRITDHLLAEKALHNFMECIVDWHVRASVEAGDLFQIAT